MMHLFDVIDSAPELPFYGVLAALLVVFDAAQHVAMRWQR
jgi:hypothetical protein